MRDGHYQSLAVIRNGDSTQCRFGNATRDPAGVPLDCGVFFLFGFREERQERSSIATAFAL
jgi:hypothetical protein